MRMGPWILGDQPNLKYRELPAEILADLDHLGKWIDDSAAAAERLAKKPKKKT
jgi:hypothetical protein